MTDPVDLGMSRSNGKPLAGDAHLAQSLGDLLSTPIGSRVMRREYGSMLSELLDQPMNAITRLLVYAAAALAIDRWEPRIRLQKVEISKQEAPGAFALTVSGYRTDTADPNYFVSLSIPIKGGADRLQTLA